MRAQSLVRVGLTCLLGAGAYAQNVQSFRPAPGTWNAFGVETARTASALEFVPSVSLNHGERPLVERDASDREVAVVIGHLTTVDLTLAVGLTDRLEVAAALPFHLAYGEGLDARGGEGAALGDLRLLPKVRLIGRSRRTPDDRDEGFGLSLSAPLTLGTGAEDRYLGEGQATVEPRVAASWFGGGLGVAGNVGFRVRPERTQIDALDVGNEVTYGAAVLVAVGGGTWAVAEVWGLVPAADLAARGNPLEAVLGVRHFSGDGAVLNAGVGSGIVADYGAPAVRVFAGLAWERQRGRIRPRAHVAEAEPEAPRDLDGDGLVGADDACPETPEDVDGYQDGDGCPELEPVVVMPLVTPRARARVQIADDKIVILEKVFFETDRAVIKPVSYDVLDEVASVVKAHEELGRILVEGHTDSRGKARHNLRLSRRRAAEVRRYLVARGVTPRRLEAAGFGEDRPIETNRTSDGRGMNRRVEFTILGGAQ